MTKPFRLVPCLLFFFSSVCSLGSTAVLLNACSPDEFDPDDDSPDIYSLNHDELRLLRRASASDAYLFASACRSSPTFVFVEVNRGQAGNAWHAERIYQRYDSKAGQWAAGFPEQLIENPEHSVRTIPAVEDTRIQGQAQSGVRIAVDEWESVRLVGARAKILKTSEVGLATFQLDVARARSSIGDPPQHCDGVLLHEHVYLPGVDLFGRLEGGFFDRHAWIVIPAADEESYFVFFSTLSEGIEPLAHGHHAYFVQAEQTLRMRVDWKTVETHTPLATEAGGPWPAQITGIVEMASQSCKIFLEYLRPIRVPDYARGPSLLTVVRATIDCGVSRAQSYGVARFQGNPYPPGEFESAHEPD